jgi:hypothetical protein
VASVIPAEIARMPKTMTPKSNPSPGANAANSKK